MELGQKLKQARLEAGLSQRALCADVLTRNMLSMIENGAAKPSMDTLQYLAARLGKSVGYFLGDAVVSPNQAVLQDARQALAAGEYRQALERLRDYQGPDPAFDHEKGLLAFCVLLELGEEALDQGRKPYAFELLSQAGKERSLYLAEPMERRRLLLCARAKPELAVHLADNLPSLDEELLLRAAAAMEEKDWGRTAACLDAAQQRTGQWYLLRGTAAMEQGQFQEAISHLTQAEKTHPKAAIGALERCYRELGDYKMAYAYACKGREK